jgi:hypothetical protein
MAHLCFCEGQACLDFCVLKGCFRRESGRSIILHWNLRSCPSTRASLYSLSRVHHPPAKRYHAPALSQMPLSRGWSFISPPTDFHSRSHPVAQISSQEPRDSIDRLQHRPHLRYRPFVPGIVKRTNFTRVTYYHLRRFRMEMWFPGKPLSF